MSAVPGPSSVFQPESTQTPLRRGQESSAFTSHRVLVRELHTDWAVGLQDRLDELTSLPIGWDGYGGRPVSFQCAFFVANMLETLCNACTGDVPAPSLVPGGDGSVQVEWHRNMFDVELDVLDAQNVVATRVNLRSGGEESIAIQNDFSGIVNWICELSDEGCTAQQG